jgi:restriction system protein
MSTREEVGSRQEMEWLRVSILAIGPRELEELTAALLRATLKYNTWISPPGGDRGVDVLATEDALGVFGPKIKVQVKHRPNRRMSAPEIRELIGALRPGDQGLCVSTGGFSREAGYEAVRSQIPIRLIDLDELEDLILKHYDKFDPDGRAVLPLQKIYWPVGWPGLRERLTCIRASCRGDRPPRGRGCRWLGARWRRARGGGRSTAR